MRSKLVALGAMALGAGVTLAACSSSPDAANTSSTTTTAATTSSTPSSTTSTTSSSTSTTGTSSQAVNETITTDVRSQLVAAGAAVNNIPVGEYSGLTQGLTYYALDHATGTYWAAAQLVPAPSAIRTHPLGPKSPLKMTGRTTSSPSPLAKVGRLTPMVKRDPTRRARSPFPLTSSSSGDGRLAPAARPLPDRRSGKPPSGVDDRRGSSSKHDPTSGVRWRVSERDWTTSTPPVWRTPEWVA